MTCAAGVTVAPGDVLISVALNGAVEPPDANSEPPYWQHSNWYLYYRALSTASAQQQVRSSDTRRATNEPLDHTSEFSVVPYTSAADSCESLSGVSENNP